MNEGNAVSCTERGLCQSQECVDVLCHELGRTVGCFHYLSLDDRPILQRHLSVQHLEKEDYLWQEGDTCEYVAFIVTGHLKIKKETEFPGRDVIVGVYGTGAVVGELCVLDHSPRHVSAVALEDTDLLVITIQKFTSLLEDHPQLGNRLLKGMLFSVAARLRKSMDRLAGMF